MYDIKFRRKVLSVQIKKGLTNAETARRFDIGAATIVRWKSRIDPRYKRNKPTTKINMEALKEDVIKYPDSYQYERAKRFKVSRTGILNALRRLGVTYKKNSKASKSERKRTASLSGRDFKTQAK
jgi:transposase